MGSATLPWPTTRPWSPCAVSGGGGLRRSPDSRGVAVAAKIDDRAWARLGCARWRRRTVEREKKNSDRSSTGQKREIQNWRVTTCTSQLRRKTEVSDKLLRLGAWEGPHGWAGRLTRAGGGRDGAPRGWPPLPPLCVTRCAR